MTPARVLGASGLRGSSLCSLVHVGERFFVFPFQGKYVRPSKECGGMPAIEPNRRVEVRHRFVEVTAPLVTQPVLPREDCLTKCRIKSDRLAKVGDRLFRFPFLSVQTPTDEKSD